MTAQDIRLTIEDQPAAAGPDGTWWPGSRLLAVELPRLVDGFPVEVGRVTRLLYSRPDWDDAVDQEGHGVRKVVTSRGACKVGSFPRDDTRLVIATLSTGERLRLAVVHEGTERSVEAPDGPA
ncbi:DUF5994 family protein [Nocardioides litoris]|uniref:DUF5994 family protein n=1 Tax=Nocardioides litoris TaxID=1926648 RepID=UPI0011230BF8|nr:DUF5994 family protein [Nocardioides litoris]